jgi:hypothetical protein
MFGKILTCAVLFLLSFSACSTPALRWRQESLELLERARMESGEEIFATEFKNAEGVIMQGESLLIAREYEEAEDRFHLAFMKLELLEKNLQAEKLRRVEEAQLKAAEEKKALELKLALEASRIAEEKRLTEIAKREREAAARSVAEKPRQIRERPPVAYYTVRRGESLPLIASQPEVYGDRNLWPLIYRANRDQISDPRHIWPGQVFRIPRNLSRDDIAEARRYAQEKSLH